MKIAAVILKAKPSKPDGGHQMYEKPEITPA
jgi:hypothetical protein